MNNTDLFELMKATTDAAQAAFKAGRAEGYTVGYREGWEGACEEALKIVNKPKERVA